MSNFCLKLIDSNKELNLVPLFIGLNRIGRLDSNDICLLHKVDYFIKKIEF